jgi:hypothetical protein
MAQPAGNFLQGRFLIGFELHQDLATALLDNLADQIFVGIQSVAFDGFTFKRALR